MLTPNISASNDLKKVKLTVLKGNEADVKRESFVKAFVNRSDARLETSASESLYGGRNYLVNLFDAKL